MFWQLYGTYCLLVLISVGILGFVVVRRFENDKQAHVQESLRSAAILIDQIIQRREINTNVKRELDVVAKKIGMRITLIGDDGVVLADTAHEPHTMDNHAGRPEVYQARTSNNGFGNATRFSDSVNTPMMYLALHTKRDSNVAYVRTAIPLTQFHELVAGVRNLVWTAAGLIAVVFLGVALLFARRISKPLQILNDGVQQIAGGQFGHKVYVDVKDEIGQLAGTINHMSERLAEQFHQLDEDRQKLQAVLGSMAEGVVAIDREQRVLFANARAGHLLGFNTSRPVGRRLWELAPQRNLQSLIENALHESVFHRQELEWTRGEKRSVAVHLGPLPGDPPLGVVLVFSDTTDLRRLERLRQEFVANVSHELKTPLSAIKACHETLIDGAVEDATIRTTFLARIGEQTERLHNLIHDLLSLARIENELETFVFQAVSVRNTIDASINHHRPITESKKQTLQRTDPAEANGGTVSAWVDEEAFRQILDNLIDNAVKYTPEGGTISVVWGAEHDYVFVQVHDNGIGIPEADIHRIFERFYRVDKARSRELGGTGLGLSIVKHLVASMHGRIKADSKTGEGTTFTVFLPAASKSKVN